MAWDSLSTGQKWGVGAGLGAAATLPMLFGGGGGDGAGEAGLTKSATDMTDLSKSLNSQSQDLFRQIAPMLRDLLSNNSQSVLLATMPERRRVMDQYDAARKSLAEFGQRSGGTAGANNEMMGKEASDLASIKSTARQGAMGDASGLAGSLQSAGLNAGAQALNAQNALANIDLQHQQMSQQNAAGLGQSLGSLLALAFL